MIRKRVGYLTPLYFDEGSCIGGGERYPMNLARGVARSSAGRVAVELISFGPTAMTKELDEAVSLRVLPAASRPPNPLDLTSWELPETLAQLDLLHIHQAYTRCAEVGLLLGRQLGLPICVTDHGGFTSPLGVEVGALELADRVVAYSEFGASFYRTNRPIEIVKGGVDAGHFTPPPVRPPREGVLYVGRLLPHKGIDQLIAALPPELPLTVCGRPYHPAFWERLQGLAAGKKVVFNTDADDATLLDLYARSIATVLPSVYRDCYGNVYSVPELMGFTLLESMACGTPAIASRVGAMPEFVDHGVTGFVYDSLAELTGYLTDLASDPGRADTMGAAARRAVETEYALEVAGGHLLRIYERLWSEPNRHHAAA